MKKSAPESNAKPPKTSKPSKNAPPAPVEVDEAAPGKSARTVAIRNPRVMELLTGALEGDDTDDLFDLLIRISGMPGPNPNLELARAVGLTISSSGRAGLDLTDAFLEQKHPYLVRVGLLSLAARASDPKDPTGALGKLHDRADEIEKGTRDAVIAALIEVIAACGDVIVKKLDRFTDGFLHAHVALEALTSRRALDSVKDGAGATARLDEAFLLADQSSRADERSQGVRLLREGLGKQIAALAVRFAEARAWLEENLSIERPESREVIAAALVALKRGGLPEAELDALVATFEGHSPLPRDPTRVIQGTRRRSQNSSKPRVRAKR